MSEALIIFVRNPVLGKVKTRLAAVIGNEKALQVYKHLLQHTHFITKHLSVTKFVYYADVIDQNDLWNGFEKRMQKGNELGERMQHAFRELFAKGFSRVCIIGSDCYELTQAIITVAFEKLHEKDIVIGPVADGGYYILGSIKMIPQLFANKQWSSDTVFSDTVKDVKKLNLTLHILPLLNDIDEEKDLQNSGIAFLLD